MPTFRLEPHLSSATYSASGAISLELSPKPYVICGVILVIRADITTAGVVTDYSDYWDRIISNISLSGGGKTYFSFSNARALHHFLRFKGCAAKRPTSLAISQTNAERSIVYPIHFGTEPWVNGRRNWADLTAAIPAVSTGNLTLTGAWGAAAAMGVGTTINAGTALDVYLYGVQPDENGAASPMAYPSFTMASPTPVATSTPFATSYNLPSGDMLRSIMVMLTNGANAPRQSDVLTSIRVYNQLRNQSIVQFGGQADNVDYIRAAEVISTLEMVAPSWPPSEQDGTNGVPSILRENEPGLIYLPLHQYTRVRNAGDLNAARYGADFRQAATGDIQLQYGVADATGITMDVVLERYTLV